MCLVVIISMFEPDLEQVERVIKEVSVVSRKVILVDNSNIKKSLDSILTDNCEVICQENSGITGAMNSGIKSSIDIADYFLLLDQDSNIKSGEILKLMNGAVKNGFKITAPIIIDNDGRSIHSLVFEKGESKQDYYVVDRTQLSGMIVAKDVFEKVGLFDEHFFLNLGDTEWCLRAVRCGFKIQVDKNVHMVHEYGNGFKKVAFYRYYFGSPFRLYYRSRDSLNLMFMKNTPFNIRFRLFFKLLITPLEICFLDSKTHRFYYFFKGVGEFFTGEKGRLKDSRYDK